MSCREPQHHREHALLLRRLLVRGLKFPFYQFVIDCRRRTQAIAPSLLFGLFGGKARHCLSIQELTRQMPVSTACRAARHHPRMVAADERFAEVRAGARRCENDLYGLYDTMRSEAPFWRAPWGDVYLSSWQLADEALSNRRLSHALPLPPDPSSPVFAWMLFQEGTEHALLRRAFQAPFAGGSSTLARSVEAIVEDALDRVPRDEPVDVVGAFTRTIPERVIGVLMGVPDEDLPLLREWSAEIRTALDTDMAVIASQRAIAELTDYFKHQLQGRSNGMFDVSGLVDAAGPRTAAANLAFIAFAGHETTVHLIASMLFHLALAPDVWRALRGTPAMAPAVVSEALRLESPVQKISRWALDDVVFAGGNRVHEGEEVVVLVGAANRDPARYTHPHRMDPSRPATTHLAFGKGVHTCLGRALALMEGEAVLRHLAGSVKEISLEDGGWEWMANSSFRGLSRLTVTLQT